MKLSKRRQHHFDEAARLFSIANPSFRETDDLPLRNETEVHKMLCTTGTALLRGYRDATKERADARDELLLFPAPNPDAEDRLFAVKRKYGKAFVAWVTHRALCLHCRTVYGRNDQAQFSSL